MNGTVLLSGVGERCGYIVAFSECPHLQRLDVAKTLELLKTLLRLRFSLGEKYVNILVGESGLLGAEHLLCTKLLLHVRESSDSSD